MSKSDHSVAGAMSRGELDEEEAFFVLRYAGHHGYKEAMRRLMPWSRFKRVRRWLVWFGGWEAPELSQWDRGAKAFEIKGSPFPLSFFGGHVTLQRFGVDIDVPFRRTRLCIRWRDGFRVFVSPDCTPGSATTWIIGRATT